MSYFKFSQATEVERTNVLREMEQLVQGMEHHSQLVSRNEQGRQAMKRLKEVTQEIRWALTQNDLKKADELHEKQAMTAMMLIVINRQEAEKENAQWW